MFLCLDNTAFSLPKAEGEILSLETWRVCWLWEDTAVRNSTNEVWLLSLTDVCQSLQCFKKNRLRGKVGSNQEEVSGHDARYNKQSQTKCQRHFLKDIYFQYIRRNWNCLQSDLPWLFFQPWVSWDCQVIFALISLSILLRTSEMSVRTTVGQKLKEQLCCFIIPRCLFFFICVNHTKNA